MKIIIKTIMLLILCFIMSSCLFFSGYTYQYAPKISGQVLNKKTGKAIVNAKIIYYTYLEKVPKKTAYTDANGLFTVEPITMTAVCTLATPPSSHDFPTLPGVERGGMVPQFTSSVRVSAKNYKTGEFCVKQGDDFTILRPLSKDKKIIISDDLSWQKNIIFSDKSIIICLEAIPKNKVL